MAAVGRAQERWWNNDPNFMVPIRSVEVVGRRPMKEIGVQQTRLDTTVLHENIALSLADALTFNSSIFVKQYGRATLSTVAFRGTSPSHTQVSWNGMRINSPMLGMTDFSMIPSYFIDDATLLHGTSSVNETGGGLGGAVRLATKPAQARGLGVQYIQGVGSFHTFDEFARITYGDDRWQLSTRAVYSSSRNDFRYRNYNKKINVYDDDHKIIGTYYPTERNKSGSFRDAHLLQEAYYNTGRGDCFGLQAWWLDSRRGVPMLSVDHRSDDEYLNEQRERTFRGIVSWDRHRAAHKIALRAGYIHTAQGYDFSKDKGNGVMAEMIRSRSTINTLYGSAEGDYYIGKRWLFTANVSVHQHFVRSQDKNVLELNTQSLAQGNNKKVVVGYDRGRVELSGYVSAKWMPTDRAGVSLAMREEMYGTEWTPLIPALFADYVLSRRGNVVAKASVSRNYRFPTLNDLYFLPGGNPDLKKEHGFTYDAGVSFAIGKEGRYSLKGEATWFDSYINDWIVWLPTFKGFWTPRNIKEVHAYGIELKADGNVQLARDLQMGLDGSFSWTPSINHGDPVDWADRAIGKQLVYVPEYSAAATGRLAYRSWRLLYKWCWYSERFTTSDNNMKSKISRVLPYFMSDVSIEKLFSFRWSDFSVKLAVKNIFNEEYESVLSRPMPRANFEIFLDIRPKWGKREK
jgi:iron complex outermembrane receptor protein